MMPNQQQISRTALLFWQGLRVDFKLRQQLVQKAANNRGQAAASQGLHFNLTIQQAAFMNETGLQQTLLNQVTSREQGGHRHACARQGKLMQ